MLRKGVIIVRKFLSMALTISLILATFVMTITGMEYNETFADVYINGLKLETDHPAMIANDRTLVPLRAICEALKCTVEWDATEQTAYIRNSTLQLDVKIGSYYIRKRERAASHIDIEIELDVPALVHNDRTLVPARAIAEALGCTVNWDGSKNRVDIAMDYIEVSDFNNGFAWAAKQGDDGTYKYGVINESRDVIIPFEYDSVMIDNSGFVYVQKGAYGAKNVKYGVLDLNGNTIIPVIHSGCDHFFGGLCAAKKDGYWGAYDMTGELAIDFVYDKAFTFENNFAIVYKDGLPGVINTHGDEIISSGEYDKIKQSQLTLPTLFEVCKNGMWGICDSLSNLIVPIEYEKVSIVSNSYIAVYKSNKCGIVNNRGKNIISVKYDSIEYALNELFCVEIDNQYGLVDIRGTEIVPISYDFIGIFVTGAAPVKKDGKCGAINTAGRVMVPLEYDWIDIYFDYNGLIQVSKNKKYGFVNINGKEIVPCEYDKVEGFQNGIAKVHKDGYVSYVNIYGQTVNAVGEPI